MNRLLLLTSTVSPSTIEYFGTIEQRQKEYEDAIQFYLKNTHYKILVVDNSGFDFSLRIKNERFEALYYVEPEENNVFGKGYCETKILKFAFAKSVFLQEIDMIIKITGRHIINNINVLIKESNNINTVYADTDINLRFAQSYFFIAPKEFFTNYFFFYSKKMNDKNGVYFEHVLSESIQDWKEKYNHCQFKHPIHLDGHPGTSDSRYKKPSLYRYIAILSKYYIYKILN